MVASKMFQRPTLKAELPGDVLLFSLDAGTGVVELFSSDFRKLVSFEPVVAPITTQRDVVFNKTDARSKPTFSLTDSGQVFVFGVEDVVNHGRYSLRRRITSMDRYMEPDYYRIVKVSLFHAFRRFAGNNEWIRPTGAISVPVSIYNNDDVMSKIRDAIIGKHEIMDGDGCILRVELLDSRILFIPECYGAFRHLKFDPATLDLRKDIQVPGSTILVDVGYETVNEALFAGNKYIRDASYTTERSGFGVVVRAIQNWAGNKLKGVDASRVDIGLRQVAGIPLGEPKFIQIAEGVSVDVQPIYDEQVPLLADRIMQDVITRYADMAANRVALNGGSAYHLAPYITDERIGWPVVVVPDPEIANSLGVMTKLYQEVLRRKS